MIYRFRNCLMLHMILVVTFVVEVLSFDGYDVSHSSFFIAEITKCFTAIIIFVLVLLKVESKSAFSKNYNTLSETSENARDKA
jgi:uncharacterized FlgJ-related protein